MITRLTRRNVGCSLGLMLATIILAGSALAQTAPEGQSAAAASDGAPAVLPGLIPAPAPLSGNRRWQMFTKNLKAAVGGAAWSPDSRWLAESVGRTVRLYDMSSEPDFQRILVGHEDSVRAIRFSPDGKRIATASLDGTARIWEAEGREVFVYREHGDSVQDISWHADGKRLATASVDGTVRVWSPDGQTLAVLSDHEAPVNAVAWSPDGKWLATGDQNKIIRLWTSDLKPGPVLTGHTGAVESLAWDHQSERLLSGDRGFEHFDSSAEDFAYLRVWNTAGKELDSAGVNRQVTHVCWSPDGKYALGSGGSFARLWNVADRQPVVTLDALSAHAPVAWQPSGEMFVAGPIVYRHPGNISTTLPLREFEVSAVERDPSGKMLAIGCGDRTFFVVDLENRQLHRSARLDQPRTLNRIHACRWSPDGKTIMAATRYSREVQLFDWEAKPIGQPVQLPSGSIRGAGWSPNGQFVAVGGDGGVVQLVDMQKREVTTLGRQLHSVTQIQFTPDGQQVCSAGFDGCVRFWSLDGQPLRVCEAINAPVRGLDWDREGKLLATGHEDNLIRLWSDADEPLAVFGGHGGFVETVTFSPDDARLASGSWDHTVRVWSRDGTPISILRGHEGAVNKVEWSLDGQQLYSGAADGIVRCWLPESGRTEWMMFFGDNGDSALLDGQGRLLHGDPKVFDTDFVCFVENDQGQLVRTPWSEIQAAMASAVKN